MGKKQKGQSKYTNIDYKKMEKAARRANIDVVDSKGNHGRFIAPDGSSMTYCRREMGDGLTCKIIKWLLARGVILGIIIFIISQVI